MAATQKREDATVEPGSIDELAHLLVLFLKYQGVPQGVLVHDLSKAGLSPTRIASLILTTPNTVSQQKRAERPDWPPKAGVKRSGPN
jgi:hypothetical protein